MRTTTTSEPGQRAVSRWLALWLAALAGLACASTAPRSSPPAASPAPAATRGLWAMGTVLELELVAAEPVAADRALDAVVEQIRGLEARVSRFEARSEVSRLRATAGGPGFLPSAALAALIERALRYHALTRGAFDVSVGPLVELWSRAARTGVWPAPSAIDEARARVGLPRVLRQDGEGRVALREPGMALDFGGLAKGYALELANTALRERGFDRGLLSFGQSSVWALGTPEDGPAWRLLVDTPLGPAVLALADRALSVSSSLSQTSRIGDRRVSHVVDPRSGEALRRRMQAIVLAPDAALAEALSTALLVLPPEEGIALVTRLPEVEAQLVVAEGAQGRGHRLLRTPGFADVVEEGVGADGRRGRAQWASRFLNSR